MIIIYLFRYIGTKGQKSVFDDISTKKLSLNARTKLGQSYTRTVYSLHFRMSGSTSEVTYRLNLLALGIVLDRISDYRPDSLIMVIFCVPPRSP